MRADDAIKLLDAVYDPDENILIFVMSLDEYIGAECTHYNTVDHRGVALKTPPTQEQWDKFLPVVDSKIDIAEEASYIIENELELLTHKENNMKPETREIRFHVPVALHKSFKELSAARGFTLAGMLRAYVRQVTLHALSTSMKHSLPTIEDETPSAEDLSALEDSLSVGFLISTSQGKAGAKYWCRACGAHVATSVKDDETCIKCGGYVIK